MRRGKAAPEVLGRGVESRASTWRRDPGEADGGRAHRDEWHWAHSPAQESGVVLNVFGEPVEGFSPM